MNEEYIIITARLNYNNIIHKPINNILYTMYK